MIHLPTYAIVSGSVEKDAGGDGDNENYGGVDYNSVEILVWDVGGGRCGCLKMWIRLIVVSKIDMFCGDGVGEEGYDQMIRCPNCR